MIRTATLETLRPHAALPDVATVGEFVPCYEAVAWKPKPPPTFLTSDDGDLIR